MKRLVVKSLVLSALLAVCCLVTSQQAEAGVFVRRNVQKQVVVNKGFGGANVNVVKVKNFGQPAVLVAPQFVAPSAFVVRQQFVQPSFVVPQAVVPFGNGCVHGQSFGSSVQSFGFGY
jgi:hypothetical protein